MPHLHPPARLATGVLALMLAAVVAADEPVPSYGDAVERMERERDKPPISAGDRQVMRQAMETLHERMPAPGLEPGARAPDFTLPNAFGKRVNLYGQLEAGPVILTFYRGAWCPYCNLALRALHQSMPHFERFDATLIAVTPQRPSRSREQLREDPFAFEVLSDLDSAVMKAYDLYFELPPALNEVYQRAFGLDLAEYNGAGRYVLPVPGTFVIDREGIVRAAFAEVDYKQRMEPADIIAALERIERGR